VLMANLLDGNHRTPNYDGLASAVFTIPPLASAGLSEEAARAQGRRFRTNRQDTSGWFHTRRLGETTAGFKVLVEEETDHVLGAHLLGPRADEVINLFAIAIRQRIPARALQEVIFAYPTHGSDVRFML
jgi:glutathione reductase (NADPH)